MSEKETLESLETEIDRTRIELETIKREIEEKKQELTKPRRELDDHELILVKKQVATSSAKTALKEKIEAQKKIDSEMVTGKFLNRRAPGQPAKLTYQKYEDDPVKWFNFEDGKVYTIPRGFMDQINEHYHTPHFIKNDQVMDPNRPMSSISEVDTSNKKYAFFETR